MFDTTDLDLRSAAHNQRVARANQKGWMVETSAPAGGSVKQGSAILAALGRLVGGVARLAERTERADERAVSTPSMPADAPADGTAN